MQTKAQMRYALLHIQLDRMQKSSYSKEFVSSVPCTLLADGQGDIVPARGPNHFGWDPVFQPKGWEKTYAEMTKEEKNSLSHRYKALDKLRSWLESLSAEHICGS